MHIDACLTQSRFSPCHGAGVGLRPGRTPTHAVAECLQILAERRRAEERDNQSMAM